MQHLPVPLKAVDAVSVSSATCEGMLECTRRSHTNPVKLSATRGVNSDRLLFPPEIYPVTPSDSAHRFDELHSISVPSTEQPGTTAAVH